MKRILFFLSFWVIMIQGIYATHIVKAPGSTTDIFSELPINDFLNPDTLFIEGGTGDIILQAGTVNNSTYDWDFGTGSISTFTITFTYANATQTLPDGSKGRVVSCARIDVGVQYIMVVYRNLPLKPTTPSGSTSVCAGTIENYSSTSTNATSYQWYLDPVEAGTLTNETTGTVTVNWNSSWTGDADLTVKGIKDANESPLSDPLTVTVATVPTKPVITGDPFVKKGSSIIYTGSSVGAVNWTWVMTPNDLATATPSGQNVTLDFSSTGTFNLTAQAHNTCGDGIVSDNFNVEIVDISSMETEITQLKADTTLYRQQTRDSSAVAQNLRLRLADSTAVINGLRTNNNLLQGQVADLEIDTVLYKSVIRFLENDSIPELHGIITTVTGERDAALTANATLTTQLATVTQERDDALADVATLTTQLATAISERDDALADVATLTTQLATAISERDDALADVATLTTQLATAISERDDALADVALLQTQVSNLEQEVADLQAIIDGGMQDLLDQIDQLEADKLVLQGQVDDLTDQVATLTASNTSLQTQVNSLTDQVATLTTSNSSLQTQVNSLTDQVATLTASNTSLQTQVNSLTDQVATLTASNSSLQTQVNSLTDQVATLTASNSSLQTQVDDLTNQVATLTASNTALQGQVDDLTGQVATLNEQLEIYSQVYILSWEVEDVTTHIFETEIGNFSVSLYPNPSPGVIFVSCTEEVKEVKIFNLQGQLIKEFIVNSFETSFTMTRADMPIGTYLVHIKTSKGNSTHRIVFQ